MAFPFCSYTPLWITRRQGRQLRWLIITLSLGHTTDEAHYSWMVISCEIWRWISTVGGTQGSERIKSYAGW
jgi:hypothetical protein